MLCLVAAPMSGSHVHRGCRFITHHECLHKLPGRQLHLMAHFRELARPASAACFHTSKARRSVRKVLEKRRTFDGFVHDFARRRIDVVQLDNIFSMS